MTTMTFTEYRDKAHRTSSNLLGENYFALGLAGAAGSVSDSIKKVVRDVDNGTSVRESMFARRAIIEDKIGDFMWYNVEFHYDYIVEAEVVIHNEREIDMYAAISAALTLILETATTAKYPDRKDFLNVTSIVADLCTALNLNLYSIMEKNIKKLESRYREV